MAEFDGDIAGISFMVSDKNVMVLTDDGMHVLDIEDVFKLAEFAAVAYEALSGAEYVHTEYDKGEFVVREGVPAIKKRGAPLPDPSFLHLMSDPGPGTGPYGREHTLERDCE